MPKIPYFRLALLFLFLAFIPPSILAANSVISLFSKAAPPQTLTKNAHIAVIKSKFGYTLNYDQTLWAKSLPALSGNAADVLQLTLKPRTSAATIIITTYPTTTELPKVVTTKRQEFAAAGSLIKDQATTLSHQPAHQFILQETFFGQPTRYTQTYAVANHYAYQLTVKTDGHSPTQGYVDDVLTSFQLQNTPQVKGASTQSTKYDPAQINELTLPSVVNIRYRHCHDVVSATNDFRFLKFPYRFCAQEKGTGFIVSDDGLVATSGHVVSEYPEAALTKYLRDTSLANFTHQLIQEVNPSPLTPQQIAREYQFIQSNPAALSALTTTLYKLLEEKRLSVTTTGETRYVSLGSTPFTSDDKQPYLTAIRTSDTILPATLIAAQVPNYYSTDAVLNHHTTYGPDVAAIKITTPKNYSFPGLPLADATTISPGFPITIIGFPELVEGETAGKSLLDYATASTTPTVTSGIVSAVKTDPTGAKLIQTDASISSGNSGGPAFNAQGQVIGLASYTYDSDSGNYNFLRSIQELKNLLEKQHLTPTNKTFTLWQLGLGKYWDRRYPQAITTFTQVKNQYPIHPTVTKLIADSHTQIQAGKSKLVIGKLAFPSLSYALGATWSTLFVLLATLTLCMGLLSHLRRPMLAYTPPSPRSETKIPSVDNTEQSRSAVEGPPPTPPVNP